MVFNLNSWMEKERLKNKMLIDEADVQVWLSVFFGGEGRRVERDRGKEEKRKGGNAKEEELLPKPFLHSGAAAAGPALRLSSPEATLLSRQILLQVQDYSPKNVIDCCVQFGFK